MKKTTMAMLFTLLTPLSALSQPAPDSGAAGSATTGTSAATSAPQISSGCVFAGLHLELGRIINYADGTRKVCALGPAGPFMIDVVPGRTLID